MVKLLKISLILLCLFSCKKDKVSYWGSEYDFLIGTWEWKSSICNFSEYENLDGSYKIYTYNNSSSEFCKLNFSENGKLEVSTNSENYKMELTPCGLTWVGDVRIARFVNSKGEVVNFTHSSNLNQLETEFNFFSLSADKCNKSFIIYSSSYEKK